MRNIYVAKILSGTAFNVRKPNTMPHTKHRSYELEAWQELIHCSIGCLADKHEMPFFQKAHMGLLVEMERSPKFKAWDISNRAVNFTINNLKGIFFTDDDVEHLSIISAPKTRTTPYTGVLCQAIRKWFKCQHSYKATCQHPKSIIARSENELNRL